MSDRAYGIFCKHKDAARGMWYAGKGRLTRLKIHASTTWSPEGVAMFEEAIQSMRRDNPEWTFEVRPL